MGYAKSHCWKGGNDTEYRWMRAAVVEHCDIKHPPSKRNDDLTEPRPIGLYVRIKKQLDIYTMQFN